MSFRTRIAGAMAAAVAVTSLAVPTASAATGNLVTLGDSFSANPDQFRNYTRAFNPAVFQGYPSTEGCLQAPNNWPRLLADQTHRPLSDWSCTAQTSTTMLGRLDRAIATGNVHNDSTVVIAVGMNNYGGFGVADGVNILDPGAVRDRYISDIKAAAAKIRGVAPQAKIVISGALPTVDRNTATFCALNVVPNAPAGVSIPLLRDVENWNRDNQRDAAAAIGARFVDMFPSAVGHDTCAPDAQRYVAGIIDTTTPNYNMAFHPSQAGSQNLVNQLRPVV